jgi:uncharacterized protein
LGIGDLDKKMLRKVVEGFRSDCGERLIDVILFGSYARGIANINSDIDILILLTGKLEDKEDFENFPKDDYETMWKSHKRVIHCSVSSYKDYINKQHKELRDVPDYGISILNI